MYPVIGGVTRGVDSHRLATRSAIRQARSMIDATGSLLVAGAGGGGEHEDAREGLISSSTPRAGPWLCAEGGDGFAVSVILCRLCGLCVYQCTNVPMVRAWRSAGGGYGYAVPTAAYRGGPCALGTDCYDP